jgi:serine/threonine protein kinase
LISVLLRFVSVEIRVAAISWISINPHNFTLPSMPNLHDYFTFGRQLGLGTFATVYYVTEKKTSIPYAMKVIEKSKAKGMEAQIIKEVSILKKLKHPHIVRLYECFETKEKIYMQIEYVDGGELLDRIINLGYYGEEDAKRCVSAILDAVSYLHRQGIVVSQELIFSIEI